MQEQSGEFYAGLPTPGEVLHRGFEHLAFDFEFPRDFSAFPVRLIGVSHEEFQRCFAGEKWVVLAKVSYTKFWVAYDFSGVEFVIAEDAFKKGRFASPVATDEADFIVST